jgi:PAS domain S-box-containing protein
LENARLYQQAQQHAAELEERVAERTAALQASEATARAMLDTAPDAVYLLDVDGYILATNEMGARRLNRLPANLVGRRIYDLLSPDVAAAHAQSIDLILSTGQSVRYEDERGGRYYDNALYPIYNAAGEVTRVAVYARDVTARRHAEEDMRRALDQERELSDLKSRFISIASHEFRTPMTTILSAAELLEHYSHRWSEAKRLDYLHRIQIAVKHMVELVNDVLVVGRADAGRMDFNPAPLDVERFCMDLVHEYQTGVGVQHTLRLSCHSFPQKVQIDEKLFRHILGNLLSNAIKYSPPGTVIEVELKHDDTDVQLAVCDSGIGIPADDLPHLFDTFHRASNVGTIPGTGLGMSILKRAVDLHGGTINVTSRIGEDSGTVFVVTLPLMFVDEDTA